MGRSSHPVCWDSFFLWVKHSFSIKFGGVVTECGSTHQQHSSAQKPVRCEVTTETQGVTSMNGSSALLSFAAGVDSFSRCECESDPAGMWELFLMWEGGRQLRPVCWTVCLPEWAGLGSTCNFMDVTCASRLCPAGAVCPDPYYQDCRRFWIWCVVIGPLSWRCASFKSASRAFRSSLLCERFEL